MSQLPYQTPPNVPYGYGHYPQDPMAALLAPAKRASIFMFILAALFVPCGGIIGFLSKVDLSQLPPDAAQAFQLMEQQASSLGTTLQSMLQTFAAIVVVPGILLLILGVAVRRGGMGSVIASIITCIILALPLGFVVIVGLAQGAQGNPNAIMGACMWGIPLVLLIVTLVFLFQAAKSAGQLTNYRMHYQAQMQQYAQNPQAYQQMYPSQQPQNWQQPGPYGYQQQAPPPPPPSNWPPNPPSAQT